MKHAYFVTCFSIRGSVTTVLNGEIIMRKYKIYQTKDYFTVWKLRSIGNGCLYDDMGRRFRSEEGAQKFIEEDRRRDGEKNDSN